MPGAAMVHDWGKGVATEYDPLCATMKQQFNIQSNGPRRRA